MENTQKKSEKMAIEPEVPRGFRDFLPEEMIPLEKLLETVQTIYRSYGFRPQQTSAIEFEEVLTGEVGGETGSQIYRFQDASEAKLGLRFDLTVPLSRIVAKNYKSLRFPYKRYQYSRVWRYDKPTPGRYREFGQFDVDIVGTRSIEADAEICMMIHDVVQALDIDCFVIRLNNRKILNALAQKIELPQTEHFKQLFRELDKIDKQGFKKVKEFLAEKPKLQQNYPEGTPLGLSAKAIEEIETFCNLSGKVQMEPAEEGTRQAPEFFSNKIAIQNLEHFFSEVPIGQEGTQELKTILQILTSAGIQESRIQIDVNIARGLDYYTGPIFETTLPDHPEFGTIFAGGRYDYLIGRFVNYEAFFKEFQEYATKWRDSVTGQPMIPATGASLGVDRLFEVLKQLKKISYRQTHTDILVTRMDETLTGEYYKLARFLREKGFRVELYSGETTKFKQQMKYADRLQIPIVLIIGENEHKQGVVRVRSMLGERVEDGNVETKEQDVPIEKLEETIRSLLPSN